jgi:outer membrane protein
MKTLAGWLAVLTLSLTPVWAAEGLPVAFVDVGKVINDSKTGKQHNAELEKLFKEKQGAIQKEEQKLQQLQQDFEKNQMLLTDAQKQEKQKAFQAKVEAYQKLRNDAQQAVNQRRGELTNKMVGEIKLVVADVAKEAKVAFVIEVPEQAVLYAEPAVNLTTKVLQRYDAKTK